MKHKNKEILTVKSVNDSNNENTVTESNLNNKNIIKRVVDFTNANSLKMLFLLIMGYWWLQFSRDLHLNESLLSSYNLPLIVILCFFGFLIFKMQKLIDGEEKLTTDIKLLTKDKLWYEREILKNKFQSL